MVLKLTDGYLSYVYAVSVLELGAILEKLVMEEFWSGNSGSLVHGFFSLFVQVI